MSHFGDRLRRIITERREQRLNELAGITGDDPFANIPGQSAPRQVSYWEPGKLYQPGDLVQANNLGDIAQTTLTNNGFESGDTGWTHDPGFSIENVAGFEGSWRAKYESTLIVAVDGDDDGVIYSVDGINWGDVQNVFTDNPSVDAPIAWSTTHNYFLVVSNRDNTVWTSPNGVNWTQRTATFTMNPRSLVWAEELGIFVMGGSAGAISTSPDGITWTLQSTADIGTIQTLVWNGSVFVAGAPSGDTILYSSDGVTWNTADAKIDMDDCVWSSDDSLFVACNSTNNELSRSGDGISWTLYDPGVTDPISELAWSESLGLFVGLGSTGSQGATSSDGITWSDMGTPPAFSGIIVELLWVETLSLFVALEHIASDSEEQAWTSPDGTTWTARTLPTEPAADLRWQHMAHSDNAPATTTNDDRAATFPGHIVTAKCKVQTAVIGGAQIGISWYDSGGDLIRTDYGDTLLGTSSNWREIDVVAVAPIDSVTCSVTLRGTGTGTVYFDYVEWDHYTLEGKSSLIFENTSAAAGHSDESEPVWPASVGLTVVDNEVTWTARAANCIVWEAKPILLSGPTEPTWPTEEGATVIDNTILWTADSGRVKDVNCPNTKQVQIVASKVFCGDSDIVAYSATINPLDWSSPNDAGFIPFGLNTYGSEPVTALGIYRSNLVVWNSKAFQMWQVDEDPQNFALLDAIPVGGRFYKSASPVSNDLVWLTDEGIRNMGIAGASTNLQAGFFGKQIDPLVKAQIDAIADEDDIISLYYPAQGQYWVIFEDEAFVLTMNGGKQDMSWSRYTFPSAIDDYTIKDSELYLRSGDKVWLFDADAVQDDVGGTPANFEGRVWWHYLDFGALGITKSLIGFDVVASGTFNVAIGYDQSNTATATTDYELTGDTLPNGVIPLPVTAPSMQFRLTWAGGEAWEWFGSALYLQDWRITS